MHIRTSLIFINTKGATVKDIRGHFPSTINTVMFIIIHTNNQHNI